MTINVSSLKYLIRPHIATNKDFLNQAKIVYILSSVPQTTNLRCDSYTFSQILLYNPPYFTINLAREIEIEKSESLSD